MWGRSSILICMAACFSPKAPSGVPCQDTSGCPSNQVCQLGFCTGDPTSPSDSALEADAPIDTLPGCVSWTAPNVGDPCALPAPSSLVLDVQGGWSVDTDNGEFKKGPVTRTPTSVVIPQSGTTAQLRVFVLDELVVPSSVDLAIDGTMGVVFVVHGNVILDGNVSVSASTTSSGAGASAPDCTSNQGVAPVAGGGGGGGSGGTHAAGGGDGGAGSDDGLGGTGGVGGGHGTEIGQPLLVPLFAGCRGRTGAGPGAGTSSGGGGGGALEITARGMLIVTATVRANGGGGVGGLIRGGGGGGGSGGAIVLDADQIVLGSAAEVVANGGGGGGGGNTTTNGVTGAAGTASATRATGGAAAGGGGVGGRGGAGAISTGESGAVAGALTASGGGGGGGSVGRIVVRGRTSSNISAGAVVSPPSN